MHFECEIQARIRDINLGGHVDNVEALRVVDEARLLFFGVRPQHGMPGIPGVLSDLPERVGPLVGSLRAEYRSEMRFAPHQPFRLRLWVGHLGGSSFTVQTELFTVGAGGGETPAMVAESAVILWDFATDQAWTIAGPTRERLAEHLGTPVELRPRP